MKPALAMTIIEITSFGFSFAYERKKNKRLRQWHDVANAKRKLERGLASSFASGRAPPLPGQQSRSAAGVRAANTFCYEIDAFRTPSLLPLAQLWGRMSICTPVGCPQRSFRFCDTWW